tara:strand:- start:1158 stop:1625 length:468 start_codon:yes stop_codon:yes gene_type:complete
MSDQTENFRNIVAGDDRLKARWEAVSDKIIADASRLLGVQLDRESIVALPSARLAVLTDDPLSDAYLEEVKQLEAAQAQIRQAELKAALEAGNEDALASLPKGRAERLSAARALGMVDTPTAAPTSVADEATLLRLLLTLPRGERLARARDWGMA